MSGLGPIMVRPTEAQEAANMNIELKKTICPFCAVGCSIWAEVENGAGIGQEPAFESLVNRAPTAPRAPPRAKWPSASGG